MSATVEIHVRYPDRSRWRVATRNATDLRGIGKIVEDMRAEGHEVVIMHGTEPYDWENWRDIVNYHAAGGGRELHTSSCTEGPNHPGPCS